MSNDGGGMVGMKFTINQNAITLQIITIIDTHTYHIIQLSQNGGGKENTIILQFGKLSNNIVIGLRSYYYSRFTHRGTVEDPTTRV